MLRFLLPLALVLGLVVVSPAAGQVLPPEAALRTAEALSAGGDHAGAARILEETVRAFPDHRETWRTLATMLSWSGEPEQARRTFEAALARFPTDHPTLRAYARFLLDTGEADRAVEIIGPLAGSDPDAEVILGTAAWWRGDLVAAAGHFSQAIELRPGDPDASAGLAAIRSGSRPWVRSEVVGLSDSQPLRALRSGIEGGVFLTPLQVVRARAFHHAFDAEDDRPGLTGATVEHGKHWPSIRLDTDVGIGFVSGFGDEEWTGHAETRVPIGAGFVTGLRVERQPYLHTLASLSELVLPVSVSGTIALDRAGWLGEAAVRRLNYPDENTGTALYAWALAPLVSTDRLELGGGYAFNHQDTDESRFKLEAAPPQTPGEGPQSTGLYSPYYTPHKLTSHSIAGGITLRPSASVSLRLGGSYAVSGREDAPTLVSVQPGAAPTIDFYRTAASPWNVRGSVEWQLTPSGQLRFDAGHMATTWYDATTGSVTLYWRL
jgi:Tfp pilus assembly protein PilF